MQFVSTVTRVFVPIAFAAFIAAGCGGSDGVLGIGGVPSDAVCTVNGEPIKTKEFDRMFGNAEKQYKDSGRDFPKKDTKEYTDLRSDLVEYLVQQELVRGQANKFKIKVSDKKIDKGVEDLKEQVAQGDEKKFKEEMERVGYTIALVRKDVEFDQLSQDVYKRVVSDIKVTDKDAKEYFDDNPDQFETKKAREIAHILVKTKPEADKIYEQVKGGDEAVFAKLAKAQTLDPSSKETGGVLPGGPTQQGQTVPEFDKTSFELKTGEVSKPVKTSFGWHVISARGDIEKASTKKFADVKGDIKKQLTGEREGEHYQEWLTNVRKDAEDDVLCRDGYVWKQTVPEAEQQAADAAAAPTEAPPEGDPADAAAAAEADAAEADDAASDEINADDAKADDAKADDAEADDAKADDAGDSEG